MSCGWRCTADADLTLERRKVHELEEENRELKRKLEFAEQREAELQEELEDLRTEFRRLDGADE